MATRSRSRSPKAATEPPGAEDRSAAGAPAAAAAAAGAAECDSLAAVLLDAWTGAADAAARPHAAGAALPEIGSLEVALGVHLSMLSSPHAARLGGLQGFKLGWRNAYPERPVLSGPLFGIGMLRHGGEVDLERHKIFSCEAEFGFTFASDLDARPAKYSEEEVRSMISDCELCIELCGARQCDSDLSHGHRFHYVADALLGSGVVRGPSIGGQCDVERLVEEPVKIFVAGKEISSGSARNNPLDRPLAALTYFVNDWCVRRQQVLAAGMLVISGHCCQAAFKGRPAPAFVQGTLPEAQWKPGDALRATFGGLGAVEAVLR